MQGDAAAKRVYFVRHGESEYNSWRRSSFLPWQCPPCSGLCIGDPMIFDAALSAEGRSTIHNIGQIDRGYQYIEHRLRALGAHIERLAD